MPAATVRYGLAHLFALVVKLLAPFVDPMRAEFAVKAIDAPRPTTPPPTPSQLATVNEQTTLIANVTVVKDTLTVNVSVDVPTPEPLFVRLGSGRGARYRPDDGHATGERFRRLMKNGRPKYELAR